MENGAYQSLIQNTELGDLRIGNRILTRAMINGSRAIDTLMRGNRRQAGAFDEPRDPCGILAG